MEVTDAIKVLPNVLPSLQANYGIECSEESLKAIVKDPKRKVPVDGVLNRLYAGEVPGGVQVMVWWYIDPDIGRVVYRAAPDWSGCDETRDQ